MLLLCIIAILVHVLLKQALPHFLLKETHNEEINTAQRELNLIPQFPLPPNMQQPNSRTTQT
jgi:hypothetical protein